ncbi:piwi-like protein Siwi [Ctenocephalides felis]|uniref:piwi-like protein Siwi n=1 Tax=Ctenocephalides felis TaxID=7515 RepID=UPI000E6E4659|nr:piwi-like protein Siwi [Ctenocephalides felis]
MNPNRPQMGRARGRAKAPPAAGQAPRPGQAPETMRPGPTSLPSQPGRTMAERISERAQPPPGMSHPQQRQPPMQQPAPVYQPSGETIRPGVPTVQQATGRALTRRPEGFESGKDTKSVRTVGGDVPTSAGRGSMRGGRLATSLDTIRTKPDTITVKQGSTGRPVRLKANYFRLLHQTNWCLYQYRVDMSPEEDRTFVRKALLANHKNTIGGYIFDGTVLYCSHRLNPDPIELTSTRKSDGSQILIRIKLASQITAGDYQYLQFFNILMRKCFEGLKLQLVGRNYFDALAKINIPKHKLQLWPGYVTSIRQHETGILMCSEITHKVMRLSTAHDILMDCKRSANFREEFERNIMGTVVLTDYNNKTYRVDGVDWNMSPASTFKKRTGEDISFMQYYKDRYGVPIRDKSQPMLISRSTDKDIRSGLAKLQALVPELCRTTGLTDQMKNNNQLMSSLAEHTRVSPDNRIQKLLDFNQRLRNTPETQQELSAWQMKLDNNLIDLSGRVLPYETIILGSVKVPVGRNLDWIKDVRSNPLLHIVPIRTWHVLFPTNFRKDIFEFVKILQKSSAAMKVTMANPIYNDLRDDRTSTYVDELERILGSGNPDIIMCVVPNNRNDRYSGIKKKACVDRAVPTQVILSKNLTSRGVMSIATKVAIQMSCKVGGAPWSVEIPVSGLMVIGFDVCHDTQSKSRSYGAMVASLDQNLTKYFSAISVQQPGQELADDLVVNVTKALHKFASVNGAFPQRIIFYRDGVGDGQLQYVYNQEVKQMKFMLRDMYKGTPPKMAYVIVSKRLNTRIFTADAKNPEPGTVVDDVITLPERYDFYLVSQTVRDGTVSPVSYNIIDDTFGLPPDKMQRLTYKLTHMYYNWSGTSRVPAPCQYAHKLAFLIGQSLHRAPNPSLDDTLYFL